MTLAFTTFAGALRLIYQNIWPLVWLSMLWLACSLPVLTMPPATAALHAAVQELAAGRDATPRSFFNDLRAYFWSGWKLFLVDGFLLGTAAYATAFYLDQDGWLQFAALPPLYVTLFLALLQMYLFPLLVGQSDKSVRLIFRNAFVLLMRLPLFTFTLSAVMATWLLICVLLNGPLLLVAISAAAFLQCVALKTGLPLVTRSSAGGAEAPPADDAGPSPDTPGAR